MVLVTIKSFRFYGEEMGRIVEKIRLSQDLYNISISYTRNHAKPEPGQFYMLRCGHTSDPLLLRPLSIYCYQPNIDESFDKLGFLVKVVGKGTYMLSHMSVGENIEIFGPLGNGFKIPDPVEHALFIAGGIGIAPLPYLAQHMRGKNSLKSATLIFGAKTAKDIAGIELFNQQEFAISIYTEDGSLGDKGYPTSALNELLNKYKNQNAIVFACGPVEMLNKIAILCISMEIPCQVSIDRRMACGVGACLGCVIKTSTCKSSADPELVYKRVCKDGPVFNAKDIHWPLNREV